MKLRNILSYLSVIVLLTTQLCGQNTNPVVDNVSFSMTGTTVTVLYDVKDAEQTSVTVSMIVSSDGGATWTYNYGTATGNIGTVTGITTTFTTKTINWTYSGAQNPNFQIIVYANDNTADGSPCAGTEKVYWEGGPNNDGAAYYKTIQIGLQCWLKENLNVGTKILVAGDQTNNSIPEKYCYGDNDANCPTDGGLYQWAEAVQYLNGATNTASPSSPFPAKVQGICPTGWHLPTYEEFKACSTAVGGSANALKAVSQGTGTNTSGFSSLFSGFVYDDRRFYNKGINSLSWSSTNYDATQANYLQLHSTDNTVYVIYSSKVDGFSVRCAKD